MAEKKIGTINHYFDKISVGIIKLSDTLKIGDKVKFKGATTDFEQEIKEMQFMHENLESGKKDQEVGVKTSEKVREGDEVFLL